MVMARELTKTFETFLCGTTAEVLAQVEADANQQRGEIVLMLHGFVSEEADETPAAALDTLKLLCDELPLKKAAAIAAQIHGLKKNALYKKGLELAGKEMPWCEARYGYNPRRVGRAVAAFARTGRKVRAP